MEFQQAIQDMIYFSDQVKDLDRALISMEGQCQREMQEHVDNGLIAFAVAKSIHEHLLHMARIRTDIADAEQKILEAKTYLQEALRPFQGLRIVYDFSSDKVAGRTYQVFLEEDLVKFV